MTITEKWGEGGGCCDTGAATWPGHHNIGLGNGQHPPHPAPGSWHLIGQGVAILASDWLRAGLWHIDTITRMSVGGEGRGLIKLYNNVANFTVYCDIASAGAALLVNMDGALFNCNGSGKWRFVFKNFHCLRPLLWGLRVLLPWAGLGRCLSPFLTHCLKINLFSRKTWGQTNINYYLRCLLCLGVMDRFYLISVSLIFVRSLASFPCPLWHLTGLNANF